MKSSVNGYHESLIEALRNAAATTSSQRGSNSSNSFGLGAGGGANTGGAGSNHRSSAASLTVKFGLTPKITLYSDMNPNLVVSL